MLLPPATATRNPVDECVAGLSAQEAGNMPRAIAHFECALCMAPALLDVRLMLAFALGTHGTAAEARAAIDGTPNVSALSSTDLRRLADAAVQLGAAGTALTAVRLLANQTPNDPDLDSTLGALLHRSGQLEEAGHVLRRAVLRWPKHVPSLLNSAYLLVASGGYHEALRNYNNALRIAPTHHTARWHRGMLRLMMGDLAGGWSDHEARRLLPVHAVKVPQALRAWDGRNAKGRTLLLWGEQGLGDQIQAVRFADHLAALGARVVVRCAAPLKQLFASAAGVSVVVDESEPLPRCDAHVPMLSVPFLLKLHDERSYGGGRYLRAGQLSGTGSAFAASPRAHDSRRALVGAAWAGSPGHTNDAHRSLPTDLLPALLEGVSAHWVSLQLGARAADLNALAPQLRANVTDAAPMLHDFVDTALVVTALDRVVTVDTSVAHLAGALGVPTLLLLPFVPDWRWQLVREDSPWYDSVVVVRQPSSGDWASVIGRAHRELAAGGQARAA